MNDIEFQFHSIANINSDSDIRAEVQQEQLLKNVAVLLETNQALSRRLMNLEDAFEVATIVSKRQSRVFSTNGLKQYQPKETNEDDISQLSNLTAVTEISGFDFEIDLETSRPYRRAQRDTMDFSFRSSVAHTNAWSQFSGLSLSKISIISAIALPLYPDEIENPQHYVLGGQAVLLTGPAQYGLQTASRIRPLYQNCLQIESQLSQIPGFPEIFALRRDENNDEDLLTFLIQVFRQGLSLLMLLARVQGAQNIDHLTEFPGNLENREQKIPKFATIRFIRACMDDFGIRPDECFTISDLFGEDSTGFIKVSAVSSYAV